MKLKVPLNISTLLLRVGVGMVFLYFGIDKFTHPETWAAWIPPKLLFYLPFSKEAFIYLNGGIEAITGFMVLLGLYTRVFALVASVILVAIISAVGINDVTVRDIAILAASLSLSLTGSRTLSIDSRLSGNRKMNKKSDDYITLE